MMTIAYGYSRDGSPATPAAKPKLLLIDGRRVSSASGRTFESLNPATEQVIATIAEGNEIDVDRAVAAARRAFEGPWRTMRAAERGHVLLKWADLLKKHVDEIAELESLDAGKPIAAVLRQDFPAAIDTLTYYAGWADKRRGRVHARRRADLHGARTCRRGGGDRTVEFPADDRDVEARASARVRLHGCHEARRANVAVGASHRRIGARGGPAAGGAQYRYGSRPCRG